ncbi:MAG: hypothetical protein PHD76_00810 [Methylacidiphilales bacterium]|nr:hypothetical protein [Candidatus Methylacidiphilales bacterium]
MSDTILHSVMSVTFKIVVLTYAAICLGFSAIGRAADTEKTATLAEVHTWGDLLAQKPVTLQIKASPAEKQDATSVEKKPLSFRLGIDRTHAKLYGAVVLYCLAQGDIGQMDGKLPDRNPSIGPFRIDIQRPVKYAELAMGIQHLKLVTTYFNALFIQTVPLNQTGSYTITFKQLINGEKACDIAMVNVAVSSESETLWSPWVEPESNTAKNAEPANGRDYCMMDVANPSSGIALPKSEGSEPIFLNNIPNAKSPLPEFIPSKPYEGIQLSLKGNELIVKLDEKEGLTDCFPDEYFLTRWWINGKPFIPKLEIPTNAIKLRAWCGHVSPVKEMHFRMEFHPEVLGVKKGDRVGMQLLYCPRGWEYVGPVQMDQALKAQTEDEYPKPISRLSNRIDFIYSGDPKSIAQP